MIGPPLWALAIGFAEWFWRQRTSSRAQAWRTTALVLLAMALLARSPQRLARRGGSRATLIAGACFAVFGYPLGRAVLRDRSAAPPQDTLDADLIGLGLLAVAEESIWGARVEPALGPWLTAVLFAIKHPLIDGRWRRVLGLGLFWIGLALVRRRSPEAATLLHVGANVSGVLVGHWSGRDQF
jgi:hypothetical protein